MKPVDPRLLRVAKGILPLLSGGALLGALRGLAILAWSWAIAHLLAIIVAPHLKFEVQQPAIGRALEGLPGTDAFVPLLLLAVGAVFTRSLASWLIGVVSERGAALAKHALRARALERIDELGPEWVARESEADLTTKLARGLDSLDNYFSQYVPQLLLTMVVTPMLVIVLFIADPVSGITVIVVFPIIPVFMVLIGLATKGSQDKQWHALKQLSAAYLDIIRGLPTLKLFRREQRQIERVRTLTEEYRGRTMKVLRVTFLSGFVLDLAGTFSIALVAVTVGTRLVAGEFPIALGLFVLLLVPEIFVPIRQVGAAFHASTEGLTAANDVFDIIEAEVSPTETSGSVQSPPAGVALRLANLAVPRDGIITEPTSLTVNTGEFVVLAGPSGVGKTSLINAVLGIVPFNGVIEKPDILAWAGQRPGLMQGTVAANVVLGDDHPDDSLVRAALNEAQLPELRPDLVLGPSGSGLSGGQAQRVAIARALYRAKRHGAKLLMLDEPTSALDTETQTAVIHTLQSIAAQGTGVLVVSHRPEVLAAADRVVQMGSGVRA